MIDEKAIENFFSSYFHEDWPMEASSDVEVIRIYLEQETDDIQVKRLAEQLLVVAKNHENSPGDSWLSERYGCYYSPNIDGLNASDWVVRLAGLIKKTSTEKSDNP